MLALSLMQLEISPPDVNCWSPVVSVFDDTDAAPYPRIGIGAAHTAASLTGQMRTHASQRPALIGAPLPAAIAQARLVIGDRAVDHQLGVDLLALAPSASRIARCAE